MNFIYEGRIDIVIGIEYVNFFENQYKLIFLLIYILNIKELGITLEKINL